jgi:hypothetical protein
MDRFHIQQFQADRGSDDVDDRIHRPDLVEMDFFQGFAVHLRFGLGKRSKCEQSPLADAAG